jgi:hypothetical protein
MVSSNLRYLKELLFEKGYRIERYQFNLINKIDCLSIVVLNYREGTDQKLIASSENDFYKYISLFFPSIDSAGEHILRRYKSEDRYCDDLKFLHDESKQKEAFEKVVKKQYIPNPKLEDEIKEFLLSKNRSSSKFKSLKTEYYENTAYLLLLLKHYAKKDQDLRSERPEYSKYCNLVEKILENAFLTDPNPIKNYLKYHNNIKLNTFDLINRINEQKAYYVFLHQIMSPHCPTETIDQFKNMVNGILDIYRRYSELAKPLINSLRIAIELGNGIPNPNKTKKYDENCSIVKKSGSYGLLVRDIEPIIRNSESHFNGEIVSDCLVITKEKDGKRTEVAKYKLNDISLKIFDLDKNLFPALGLGFVLTEMKLLTQVLQSEEYITILLGIGNID